MARKKTLSVFSWVILIGLVGCFIYFLYISSASKQAKVQMADYQKAPFCQENNDCRQIFQAKILESKTIRIEQISRGRYGFNRSVVQGVACYIQVQLSNSDVYNVTVLTNLDLDDFQFDVPNVDLPVRHWDNEDVSRTSFPEGSIVHVEKWNEKITFIFSEYVNQDNYYFVDKTIPFPPTGSDINLDTTGEYVVPTTDHPLLRSSTAETDVNGIFNLSLVLVVLFVVIRYFDKR